MDIDTELETHKQGPLISPHSPRPTDLAFNTSDLDTAPHMHPVHCRAPRIYTNTATARARSASVSSSSSSSSQSLHVPSPATPATSLDSPTPSCIPLGPPSPEPRPRTAPLIGSGFKLRELLHFNAEGNAEFIPLRVPDGISLRNFDIQVPIYATLSDIVVYSRRGATRAAFAVAEKFKQAIEARAGSRIPYNVFVLDATPAELRGKLTHVLVGPNTINYPQREKDEMRELTRASEILTVHPWFPAREGGCWVRSHSSAFHVCTTGWPPWVSTLGPRVGLPGLASVASGGTGGGWNVLCIVTLITQVTREGEQGSIAKRWSRRTRRNVEGKIEFRGVG
jgi:dual specificity MAP kinase phosphatase